MLPQIRHHHAPAELPPHSTRAGMVRTVTTLGSTAASMASGSWTGQWSRQLFCSRLNRK